MREISFAYDPPLLFKNRHLNTIYPYLLRKNIKLPYIRKRIKTPDDDFLDIDCLLDSNKKLVILCHGLEGDAGSKYIKYSADLFSQNEYDVIAMNYRGCSGEMNCSLGMYHSGMTLDLHQVISDFAENYQSIHLVGFSLGGNIILKYLGDGLLPLIPKITSAVAISVPCDLSAASRQIDRKENYLYANRFLNTLIEKIKQKHLQFPGEINLDHLKKIKQLRDFDEAYTGPIHGFLGAEDYYSQSSSKQFLHKIRIPSLIINAQDDPFLPDECYPFSEANESDFVDLVAPRYGGHVGFTTFGSKYYYNEWLSLHFSTDSEKFISHLERSHLFKKNRTFVSSLR